MRQQRYLPFTASEIFSCAGTLLPHDTLRANSECEYGSKAWLSPRKLPVERDDPACCIKIARYAMNLVQNECEHTLLLLRGNGHALAAYLLPPRGCSRVIFGCTRRRSTDNRSPVCYLSRTCAVRRYFQRIKKAGLSYGSAHWSLNDGELNDWNGGRGVYFKDPNGHVLS